MIIRSGVYVAVPKLCATLLVSWLICSLSRHTDFVVDVCSAGVRTKVINYSLKEALIAFIIVI